MSEYGGDFAIGSTVNFTITTNAATGAAVAPSSAFEAADLIIYKGSSATQRTSSAGVTMTSPFDSITGLHMVSIDTTDNTDAGFWVAAADYHVILSPDTETVDSVAVVKEVFHFSIENRSGTKLAGLVASGTLSGTHSTTTADLGTAAPSNDIAGQTLFIPTHNFSRTIDSYNTSTGVATFSPATAVTLANGNQWYLFASAPASTGSLPGVDVKAINAVTQVTPGAAGGLMIAGSNAATTFASFTVSGTTVHTGNVSFAAGFNITQSTSNTAALVVTGNGTGNGATFTSGSGATGQGLNITSAATNGSALALTAAGSGSGLNSTGGASGKGAAFTAGATGSAAVALTGGPTSGAGLTITTTSGDGIQVLPTAGNALVLTANGTSKHGAVITGGTAGTSDGIKAVAGTGGVDIRGAITGNITGTTSMSGASYQKNVAANDIPFVMVDSTDHVTRKTGLTVTATRSIDGAAFGSATGTVSEVASGAYVLDASQADMNGNNIIFRFTGTAADPVELHIKTYT